MCVDSSNILQPFDLSIISLIVNSCKANLSQVSISTDTLDITKSSEISNSSNVLIVQSPQVNVASISSNTLKISDTSNLSDILSPSNSCKSNTS
jgi:hypothetical protein